MGEGMAGKDGTTHWAGQPSPWLWHVQTRGVVTPSDFLTEEERQKLSGPVVTYVLSKPLKDEPVERLPMHPAQHAEPPAPGQRGQTESHEDRAQGVPPKLTRDAMVDLLQKGRSTTQLARIFGVSRGTVNNRKRAWGLRQKAAVHPNGDSAGGPKDPVQIEVSDVLGAEAADKLLKNLAAFVLAYGGNYEVALRISRKGD